MPLISLSFLDIYGKNTNRIISVCLELPKMIEVKKGAAQNNGYLHQKTLPSVNTTLPSFLLCLSISPGNTKGGSINVPLTSCLTGLD
jgi:hypothetical protein